MPFRDRRSRTALYLPGKRRRAYLQRMLRGRHKPIAVVLAAALAVLGTASGVRAGSSGQLDPFVVRDTIRKDLPKIHRCYESALRYEPELAGKVKVRFAVLRKGHVKTVKVVENTTGHAGVERCVARVIKSIRFPSRRSGKPLSFTFPFVFAPQ